MFDTRTGNALSTKSAAAADLYRQAIDLILGSESGTAEMLDDALALDRNFALAAAARYCVAKDAGEHNADIYQEQAQQASLNTSDWEREHIEVLVDLIEQPIATRDKALAYVAKVPADLLVVSQLAGSMFFFDGAKKLATVLDLYESVAPILADDWALLARLGFAASEAGQRQRGRKLLERALAMRPQSLYCIHGLAHLLHDEGAAEESTKLLQHWLKTHGADACQGQMYGHVQWHLALAEWQTGNREAAMQRYLDFCAPETTTCGPILTLADCAGFLLREHLQRGMHSPLTEAVHNLIARVWAMIDHPFVALHVAGLYVSAGDVDGLERCAQAIAATPDSTNRGIALALVSALTDFSAGNYQASAQTLATISPDARIGIGGSNVERILVNLVETSCQLRRMQQL